MPKSLELMTSNLTPSSTETITTFCSPLLIQMRMELTLISTEVMLMKTMLKKLITWMMLQLNITLQTKELNTQSNLVPKPPPFQKTGETSPSTKRSIERNYTKLLTTTQRKMTTGMMPLQRLTERIMELNMNDLLTTG